MLEPSWIDRNIMYMGDDTFEAHFFAGQAVTLLRPMGSDPQTIFADLENHLRIWADTKNTNIGTFIEIRGGVFTGIEGGASISASDPFGQRCTAVRLRCGPSGIRNLNIIVKRIPFEHNNHEHETYTKEAGRAPWDRALADVMNQVKTAVGISLMELPG